MGTLKARDPQQSPAEAASPRTARRKNQAHFDLRGELTRIAGVDLTRIPGIEALTAQTLIAEVGADLSAFPTEKHFVSWLALCPNHAITGGRIRRRKSRPSASRVATALRVAAQNPAQEQDRPRRFLSTHARSARRPESHHRRCP
jgi:transposase